jgi:hypothetical protein
VKTADIQREFELRIDFEIGHITDEQLGVDVLFLEFTPCNLDGACSEIYTCYLPARFGKCNDIRTCAAAKVDGAACGVMPLSHGGFRKYQRLKFKRLRKFI